MERLINSAWHVQRPLYITGGAGCITAIHQTDADHYRSLGNVRTASGARTCYFDSDSQCCTSACHIGRDNRRQCASTPMHRDRGDEQCPEAKGCHR